MDLGHLFDDRPLAGPRAVLREISPELLATAVNASDLSDATTAIERLCQLWGGGCGALLPAHNGELPTPGWSRLLESGGFDSLATRGALQVEDGFEKHFTIRVEGMPMAEPAWSALAAERAEREQWPVLQARLPSAEDPWRVAYLGCLGALADEPDAYLVQRAGLMVGVTLEHLMPVDHGEVEEPGAEDLIRRLRARGEVTPRVLSLHRLVPYPAVRSTDLAFAPRWTDRGWMRLHAAANIFVVYKPRSVADLALLWTLRAAHGAAPGVPIGVPAGPDLERSLRVWTNLDGDREHVALDRNGLPGRPWALTSASISRAELEALAAGLPGDAWVAVDPDELLQPIRRPALRSTEVVVFTDGGATIPTMGQEDREVIAERPLAAWGPLLRLRVSVTGRELPPLRELRGGIPSLEGWRQGGYDRQLPREEVAAMQWPDPFSVLEAAAGEHGLAIRPSRPGRASVALLRRVGSFAALDALKHDKLLELVLRLGERTGISYFRSRVRDLQADLAERDGGAAAHSAAIEQHLANLTVPPIEDEQHELTFEKVRTVLRSGTATHNWLEWAEDAGLLVRGARTQCDTCGTQGWRTIGELAPPVLCAGCGGVIRRPFPSDRLTFRYRASRMLLEVLAADALPHLLCAAWWSTLRPNLFGIHPGIEFLSGKTVIAEVDVVLMEADGRLVLGECKQRPTGLIDGDVEKLEALADRIDAAYTFYAVPCWTKDLTPPWIELRRDLPDRRRFTLTAEQLLAQSRSVTSLMSIDETAPAAADEEAITAHHARFIDHLTHQS